MCGQGRKTWRECVKEDTDELGLHPEWAVFRGHPFMTSTPRGRGNEMDSCGRGGNVQCGRPHTKILIHEICQP